MILQTVLFMCVDVLQFVFIICIIIDLAKDTSDTDWSSEESAIEFEIPSSDNEQIELGSQVITGDGSSDTEEVIKNFH